MGRRNIKKLVAGKIRKLQYSHNINVVFFSCFVLFYIFSNCFCWWKK